MMTSSFPVSVYDKLGATSLLISAGSLLLFYIVTTCTYNYFFHPLSKYPGPKLAAISQLWYARHWVGGRWARDLFESHLKYGDVVRIAPNELFIATLPAFEEVYGHSNNKRGRRPFLKSSFYDNPDEMSPLGAERDPVRHADTRRKLAHSFSATALSAQESMVMEHIDLFMKQLSKMGTAKEGVSIDEWFNWLTFDIIGDLAFGESFGAVKQAKSNPEITMLVDILYAGSVIDVFRRIPWLQPLAPLFVPITKLKRERAQHQAYTLKLMRQRIAKGNDRPDFFGHLLNSPDEPSEEWLRTNASSLLIAGSETTATALTGLTYYVLERPAILRALQEEVREAFQSHEEITEAKARELPYLNAVVKEALRIFIPLPINVPRVSPGAVIQGEYIPKGTIVSGHQFTLGHSPKYFKDAEDFHPERWLPSSHKLYNGRYGNDTLEASLPFLTGPRTCLGKNLAYMEQRLIVAKMVFLFEWEALQELGPGREVDWTRDTRTQFLWAKPELKIRYKVRDGVKI